MLRKGHGLWMKGRREPRWVLTSTPLQQIRGIYAILARRASAEAGRTLSEPLHI